MELKGAYNIYMLGWQVSFLPVMEKPDQNAAIRTYAMIENGMP